MNDILSSIATYKKDEVISAKKQRSLSSLDAEIAHLEATRGFADKLSQKAVLTGLGLIAEIKKASPSKGLIRKDFDPKTLALAYKEGGAACLSVLTDEPSFQGHPQNLALARNAVDLPLLRKDFMLDTYQVAEARVWGADAILIIMAMIDDACASDLLTAAQDYNLDALIEVHNAEEMERALKLNGTMIGVNNRNLKTFETDLNTTQTLAKMVPNHCLLVAESGINTPEDVTVMHKAKAKAILVGETLMRADDVTTATRHLLQGFKA